MSLAIKSGLHEYLRVRIQWVQDVIEYYGGSTIYLSGFRTRAEQTKLWEDCNAFLAGLTCPYPVAVPGCSQHEYGMAVDVAFLQPGGDAPDLGEWQAAAREYAKLIGLVTVAGDPNHFQVWPGAEFRKLAQDAGECPIPVPRRVFRGTLFDNFGPDCLSMVQDQLGLRCTEWRDDYLNY